jgi:hypothetical protein
MVLQSSKILKLEISCFLLPRNQKLTKETIENATTENAGLQTFDIERETYSTPFNFKELYEKIQKKYKYLSESGEIRLCYQDKSGRPSGIVDDEDLANSIGLVPLNKPEMNLFVMFLDPPQHLNGNYIVYISIIIGNLLSIYCSLECPENFT